jgi:two-component system nitrogen regulation response regulator GlnG
MVTLLIIDDEPNVRFSLEQTLASDELEVHTAETARQGVHMVARTSPDAVILDLRLPDMPGLDDFEQIRRLDERLPVIIITAFATTDTAIEAMKRGAFEYLVKPVDQPQLRDVVARAVELNRLRRQPPALGGDDDSGPLGDRIVGKSDLMQAVYKAIGRVASQDVTVLVTGASGTGKELVARAIYDHSKRAAKPFLAINCAAIPETLLESELFGHDRGAFTGADRKRIGKFEQAHLGTLFLDEIGDMSPATQAKVLRLLQQQQFERVGGNETVQADVRLIAATNKNLDEMVSSGRFRTDLLYRLNGFTIHLPPLAERTDDIPLLADHFRRVASQTMGKTVGAVASEVLDVLQSHDWPGNVRELQSAINYAVVHAVGEVITLDCIPPYLRNPPAATVEPDSAGSLDIRATTAELLRLGVPDIFRRVTQATERLVLEMVLNHVRGNQVQASDVLGISRTTLRAKLQAFGLSTARTDARNRGPDDLSDML